MEPLSEEAAVKSDGSSTRAATSSNRVLRSLSIRTTGSSSKSSEEGMDKFFTTRESHGKMLPHGPQQPQCQQECPHTDLGSTTGNALWKRRNEKRSEGDRDDDLLLMPRCRLVKRSESAKIFFRHAKTLFSVKTRLIKLLQRHTTGMLWIKIEQDLAHGNVIRVGEFTEDTSNGSCHSMRIIE